MSEGLPPAGAPKNDALVHFDFLRGIAACAVAVGHVRGLFFVDYDKVQHPTAALKALYLLTGLGHQAVVVFFVLSGFFVGSSVLSSKERWSWRHYLLRRFTRLYVVHIPALLLTAAIDRGGMALFGEAGIYIGKFDAPYTTLADLRVTGTVTCFLQNLVFLQGLWTRCFGSNGPLWSLPFEFWAYILFPLLVQAWQRRTALGLRLVYLALAVGLLYFGGERLRFYFPVWLFGAAVAVVWRKLRVEASGPRVLLRMGATGLFLGELFLARVRFFGNQDYDDLALATATTALLLALLITGRGEPTGVRAWRAYRSTATHFAGFSFTLYMVHFPALTFAAAALLRDGLRWEPDRAHLALGAALSIAIIWCFGYPIARLTEAHTDRIRRWLGRALRIELPVSGA